MRLGQTSAILFVTRLGSSILGALATVYIARVLGSEVLGVYFLVLALVGWLKIGNIMGISRSLTKRVSEGNDKSSHVIAGLVLTGTIFVALSAGVYLARGHVNDYLGGPLYQFVVALLGVQVAFSFASSVIKGERLVHFQGFMGISQTVVRSSAQILAVFLSFGLIGLLVGEIVGFVSITLAGVVVVLTYYDRSVSVTLPKREHFRSIFDFAKYSWLSNLQGKAYNLMDKVVLGFFVSSGLVGIYSICWNVAAVLSLFSKSVGTSFFPEMSKLSSDDEDEKVARYLEDMLSYSGLLILPGFVGALVVGEGILNIYGDEFRRGYVVLVLLVGASVFHSYYLQFVRTMDAIDRPDLSFKINLVFVVSNVGMNVGLVYLYGWTGAAVATLLSVFLATVLSYLIMKRQINFSIPVLEISRQVASAVVMGAFVYASVLVLRVNGVDTERVVPVLFLVGAGAAVYFACLIGISSEFRDIVSENLPVEIVP